MKTTYSRETTRYRSFLINHLHHSSGYRHSSYLNSRVIMIRHSLPLLYRYLHTLSPADSDTTDRDRIITHKYITNRISKSDDITLQNNTRELNEDTTK